MSGADTSGTTYGLARRKAVNSVLAELLAPLIDDPLTRMERGNDACTIILDRLAALASAPAGDGYGKWHPMLLDIVNATHGDRGEKTQAIGIDLSYQQALAAALARPRAAVGEREAEAIARAAADGCDEEYPEGRRQRGTMKWGCAYDGAMRAILVLQSPPAKG